jgi:hypothetical protein
MLRFRASDFPRTLWRSLRRTGLAVVLRELCAECAGALRGFFGDSPGTFRKLSENYLGTLRGPSGEFLRTLRDSPAVCRDCGNFPGTFQHGHSPWALSRVLRGLSGDFPGTLCRICWGLRQHDCAGSLLSFLPGLSMAYGLSEDSPGNLCGDSLGGLSRSGHSPWILKFGNLRGLTLREGR